MTAAPGANLIARLVQALDEVRREWIVADPESGLALNIPYGSIAEPISLETFRRGSAAWPGRAGERAPRS